MLLCSFSLSAQIQSQNKLPLPPELFRTAESKSAVAQSLRQEIGSFGLLELDGESYAQLLAAAPSDWTLTLPVTAVNAGELTLHLRPRPLFRQGMRLRQASTNVALVEPFLGLHYVGEIIGEPGSRVSLSLLDNEMTATLNRPNGERLALGLAKTNEKSTPSSVYVLFPDGQLLDRQELECATPDSGLPYSEKELGRNTEAKSTGGCVDIYFEVDYDIFYDKGSVSAAAQHIAANFNEVATLYETIDIDLRISEIFVWDEVSPYAGTSSSTLLTQFQNYRQTFNGDLAQLVSYQASGGIAVLDGLCHPYNAARMSFSSIQSNFAVVPIYSWSTLVIAHELGHLMGSQHTHACVWNGDTTAIDGCPGWTEGYCATPGIPAEGGTIMSYCHLRSVGTNFMNGFSPQPAAVMSGRVASAQNCVQAACERDDDDNNEEEDPVVVESCEEQTVYLRLTLDDFGMETSWEIRAETGELYASGGPYPKKQSGRLIQDTICVPDGCYNFTISDSDFDGICCKYGTGSYELIDSSGAILGIGSKFDTLDIIDFCLPDLPPSPNGDCETVDFFEQVPGSYAPNQDAGTVTVSEDGSGIYLENNAWKAIEYPYEVTEETWVSFWFKSDRPGEVHGFGMDDNDVISANLTFRLYGTQNWGIGNFDNYPGDGRWKYYQIPVGQFYTGPSSYLFFTADHDVGTEDGNSYFRGVTVSEGAPCGTEVLPETAALTVPESSLRLRPNPANDVLEVRLPEGKENAEYQLIDLNGRILASGSIQGDRKMLSVVDLPPGTYMFRYRKGGQSETKRFTVFH